MIRLLDHLFYRMYWWNTNIVKEKDLTLFSALLGVATFHVINFSTLIFCYFVFVAKDVTTYPKWAHILLMITILIVDYIYFIHNCRYKKIVEDNFKSSRSELKRNDFYIIIYMSISIFAVIYIISKARELI